MTDIDISYLQGWVGKQETKEESIAKYEVEKEKELIRLCRCMPIRGRNLQLLKLEILLH